MAEPVRTHQALPQPGAPSPFLAAAQGAATQAPTFSLQSLMAQPNPGATSQFANEAFLKSQEASRGHILQQVQNAANEIGRQNQFALEQLGQLPSRFEGIYGAADQTFKGNVAALQGGPGTQGAEAQMAPILAALAQQKAGNLSNVPLLEAGTREQGTRMQGQLAMRGSELLADLDRQTAEYIGQREGEERQHTRAVEAEERGRVFEREQGEIARQHTEKMAEIDHKYRMGELSAQQAFQQKEAEKARAHEAAQAAAARKAEADRAADERSNRVAEDLAIYEGRIGIDKKHGIGDFAAPKENKAQQQTIDSILRSYGDKDTSVTRGAAILQDPSGKDLTAVLQDKDYQEAISRLGTAKPKGLFGNKSSLIPGVGPNRWNAEELAKELEKKGKYRSAAVLRAQHGDEAGTARDSILSMLLGG